MGNNTSKEFKNNFASNTFSLSVPGTVKLDFIKMVLEKILGQQMISLINTIVGYLRYLRQNLLYEFNGVFRKWETLAKKLGITPLIPNLVSR